MREAAQIKTASDDNGGIFYKCPIGGFASLRPGYCPKCREALTPVSAVPASTTIHDEARAPGMATASTDHRGLHVAG